MAQKHADRCIFDHDCADCRRVGKSVAHQEIRGYIFSAKFTLRKSDSCTPAHSVIKGVKSSKFKSTDQILTTYLTFYALFNGDGFEICNQHLHDLHGLFFPTNIFVFFLNLFLSIFIFHQKKFQVCWEENL